MTELTSEQAHQQGLNSREALQDVRIVGGCSLHAKEAATSASCPHSWWRCVYCNSEWDMSECRDCGKQRVEACHFDDDYN
jgi:hypothetical protein